MGASSTEDGGIIAKVGIGDRACEVFGQSAGILLKLRDGLIAFTLYIKYANKYVFHFKPP